MGEGLFYRWKLSFRVPRNFFFCVCLLNKMIFFGGSDGLTFVQAKNGSQEDPLAFLKRNWIRNRLPDPDLGSSMGRSGDIDAQIWKEVQFHCIHPLHSTIQKDPYRTGFNFGLFPLNCSSGSCRLVAKLYHHVRTCGQLCAYHATLYISIEYCTAFLALVIESFQYVPQTFQLVSRLSTHDFLADFMAQNSALQCLRVLDVGILQKFWMVIYPWSFELPSCSCVGYTRQLLIPCLWMLMANDPYQMHCCKIHHFSLFIHLWMKNCAIL